MLTGHGAIRFDAMLRLSYFLLNALEALLGINPLQIVTEKKACLGALRLPNIDELKQRKLRVRIEVLKNCMDNLFVKILDHCVAKLVTSHRFSVTTPRPGWDGSAF